MIGVIKGTGSCVPGKVVTNDDIAGLVETSDGWIRERTGIEERHIATEETCVDLAAEAARRALQNAGMDAEELDMILVSTISPTRVMPCTACEVQAAIGAKKAQCFDLSAACSGFVVAWNTVNAYMAAGFVKKALIIGSECLSKLTDWQDRSTCILFGDGAGAVAVSAEAGTPFLPATYADGASGEALTLQGRYGSSRFVRRAKETADRQAAILWKWMGRPCSNSRSGGFRRLSRKCWKKIVFTKKPFPGIYCTRPTAASWRPWQDAWRNRVKSSP